MLSDIWEKIDQANNHHNKRNNPVILAHVIDLFEILLDNFEAIEKANKINSFKREINKYLAFL